MTRRRPRLQRIGLSATVRPLEVGGAAAGRRPPAAARRSSTSGSGATWIWRSRSPRTSSARCAPTSSGPSSTIASPTLAREHRSTLVFVNTRRLVERVTLHLGERLGADAVAAHHGSLSRERRLRAERRLKAGELQASWSRPRRWSWASTSAPSSSRCLIGSPRSIVDGAAAHRALRPRAAARRPRGGSSRSRATSWSSARRWCARARRGEIDAVALRDAPLDVLAQQIVAACACRGVGRGRALRRCAGARRRTPS